MNKAVTIFGREPVAWLGLLESALLVLVAFGVGVTQETFGPIFAVVTAAFGVYTAWATRDTMLGVIVGLFKSLIILAAVYGLAISDEQTAALVAVVTMVVSFWQRTQTSPVSDPVDPSPAQVVPVPDPAAYSGDSKVEAAYHDPSAADDLDHSNGAEDYAPGIMRHDP